MKTPELSVVIPTLNESEVLPQLLSDLAVQRDVQIELVIVDAGSQDDTVAKVKAFFAVQPYRGQILITDRGRGLQLNRGADVAKAEWLLFLHADSRLPLGTEISSALSFLRECVIKDPNEIWAGHFALRFDLSEAGRTLGYVFYETKARLNRPGCIHGDQGFLIRKRDFCRVGPFLENLPLMEDTLFADRVLESGHWLLLPADIVTSARRFQTEGLAERQTLNALLMNFMAIGWQDFFAAGPEVYRAHPNEGLDLKRFFQLIRNLLRTYPWSKRRDLWLSTGRYVCRQIWQIGLYLDCRRAYAHNNKVEHIQLKRLRFFDRYLVPATNNRPSEILTACLVRIWFAWVARRR